MKTNLRNTGLKNIDHSKLRKTGKPYKIYTELLDQASQDQFFDVLSEEYVTYGALMPDAHGGYTMPIGGVCATKGKIVPQFVGFDIGCGMCAFRTEYKKSDLSGNEKAIHQKILEKVPTGFSVLDKKTYWEHGFDISEEAKKFFEEAGLYQLGTLGGGNHFMEVGYDEDNNVWIIVHSGSRGVGAKIAGHYIKKAYFDKRGEEFDKKFEEVFETKLREWKKGKEIFEKRDPDGYSLAMLRFRENLKKRVAEKFFKEVDLDKITGIYPLDVDSEDGKNYIRDQRFALAFALENRERMVRAVNDAIGEALGKKTVFCDDESGENPRFINRNHNHVEFDAQRGEWIHRKGATHAEKGMWGVIPGNMRDGSFIVRGRGNPDSLCSSSHGAGRVMSRKAARDNLDIESFKKEMEGIEGTVCEETLDESPFAYKDIFEVMELQTDLVDVVAHIKPLINVKDATKSLF